MLKRFLSGLLAASAPLLVLPAYAQELGPPPRPLVLPDATDTPRKGPDLEAGPRPRELPRPERPERPEVPNPSPKKPADTEPAPGCPLGAPCAPCPRPPVTVCIPPKIYLIDEARETTLPSLNLHEVDVARITRPDIAVSYKEERRTVTVMESRPRQVEQPITVKHTEMVPECDPHTGCTHYVPHEVCETKMTKVTVFDVVPAEKTIIVRVPVIKCIETPVTVSMMALEPVTLPAIEARVCAKVMPPMQITVQPPPLPPPPPPPPPPCPPPCHHP